MISPGSSIALLVLGITAFCGIIYWILKLEVDKFVQALFAYRRKVIQARESDNPDNATPTESA